MNNLIRLSDGQALIVADDPWQLYDENLVTDAALILPLQQWRDGVLYINGEAVKRELVGSYKPEGRYNQGTDVPVYRETLPNGVSTRNC